MQLTQHKKHLHHHKIGPVNFALLITSDSRTPKTDLTGRTIIKLICSLPGSVNAVKLALSKLILPELTHLVWEIQR